MNERQALRSRIEALIHACEDGRATNASERDALIEDLSAWQSARVPAYGRLARRGPLPPALPTDLFRFLRIAAHPESRDVRRFQSSGTTAADARSVHAFAELDLYDLAARVAAQRMLFRDPRRLRLVILAPRETEAPHSSLSYMLSRFGEWFGTACSWVWRDDRLDLDALHTALHQASRDGEPCCLLGTSFAFVHAEDGLGDRRFELPPKSRIMQTGGYKGRSRTLDPAELRALMTARYGVPEAFIVGEYGMTELSSQMYETTLRDALEGKPSPRRLWVPPWVRATPVDPDTLQAVEGDAIGILRIDDCANLDSVCCIQTADLAQRSGDGIVVLGRMAGATPRGCSLAADQVLGRGQHGH
jgi:hypothetical protein